MAGLSDLGSGALNFGSLPNAMLGGVMNPPSGQSNPGFGALLNFTQQPQQPQQAQQPALSANPSPAPALAQANASAMQSYEQSSGGGFNFSSWQQLIQALIHNMTMSAGGGAGQSNVFSNLNQNSDFISGLFGGAGSGIYGR